MKLLFKRNQTAGGVGKVKFQLWGKVELDDDEKAIVKRYNFDDAILVRPDDQPTLLRNTALIAIGVFIVLFALFASGVGTTVSVIIGLIGGGGAGYFYFDKKRETIYVKDLIHGRYFSCPSIIDLARKEAYLDHVVAYLRQVMESAKHWDGTETFDVEALPKDEAKLVMLRGL
jgi:hypothetical protein